MTSRSMRSTRSAKSAVNEKGIEMYEMKEIVGSHRQERLFDPDARETIRMNRIRQEKLGPLTRTEELSRDVQILNHCFGDIERFVYRLQKAAESQRYVERRKSKKKNIDSIYDTLGYRAKNPPSIYFTDIFQKFKLAINLLSNLKGHIHAPNSPELVHFLFTPLSLIFEASRDPNHCHLNLSESALTPMLTVNARELLLNCLTSSEMELWNALGKNWTMTDEDWKGILPLYIPKFYDGWEPHPRRISQGYGSNRDLRTVVLAKAAEAKQLFDQELSRKRNDCPSEASTIYCRINDYQGQGVGRSESMRPPTLPSPINDREQVTTVDTTHDNSFIDIHMFENGFIEDRPKVSVQPTAKLEEVPKKTNEILISEDGIFGTIRDLDVSIYDKKTVNESLESEIKSMDISGMYGTIEKDSHKSTDIQPLSEVIISKLHLSESQTSSDDDAPKRGPLIIDTNTADFLDELKKLGISACEVIHDRESGNTRELSLKSGDIVGLIDNHKNWWKVRNKEGVIGFAPYTILRVLKDSDGDRMVYKL